MKTAQDRETTSAGQRQSPWRGAGPALALFASAYLGLGRAFEVPALILLAEVAFLGVVAAHVVHRGPDLLTGTRYRGALFAVYLLAILVVLQAWNPNTPGLGMWAIGARKSFLPAIALVAGYVWQIDREELLRVVRVVAWLMLPVLVFGVFDFLQPTAIGMAVRAAARADRYTGEIGGVTRAVSVLPGPFHFGMLGLLGVGVALAMPERRLLRLVLGAAGVAAVVTSLTRTNLVGLVVVPVVYLVVARRAGAPKRLSGWLLTAVSVGGLAWAVTQAARYDLDNVSRVASRLEGYSTALRAVARKPITGFGLGSAADAYDEEFVSLGLEHFTTHNMFLKLQIELGVVGVLLWLALLVPLAVRAVGASSDHDASPLAAVMLAALVLNGVVGSGLDAWPVSGLALFLAAAAVGSSQRPWT